MGTLRSDDSTHVTFVLAVRAGDLTVVQDLLAAQPEFATCTIDDGNGKTRSPLHAVTDWPGYFRNGPDIARLLLSAGADPDAAITGAKHSETPLHWAASSDDLDVARILIDAGANIEAPHGSIGTPLDNAVGYGCWHVARLLVERGAHAGLWQTAALGMNDDLSIS